MKIVPARDARAAIAMHVLGDAAAEADPTVGGVTLHPHQRDAVERIARILDHQQGALLADDVGLGKTFVALAIGARYAAAGAVVVIAPAAIRDAWVAAATRAEVAITFSSVEMLARRGPPAIRPALVIVDEAHRLRSAATKGFHAAATLCAGARVLLLTATPVQNSVGDLRTVLSLFLGRTAEAMSPEQMARFIVRRFHEDLGPAGASALGLPSVTAPVWLRASDDADCLDRLLALPRAVPPYDGDDGGVLLTYTLVRQWASSRAALRTALRRRLANACALEDALAAGRLPTRAELNAWSFADGAQQLVFPELAASHDASDAHRLLEQLRAHADGVRDLLAWIAANPDADRGRARLVRHVMSRHPGERVVAFSEYAATVEVLYSLLSRELRVAVLAHSGGRVAGGAVSRADVLARFAPGASARTAERDRIDLLLTTDVLSEGVNLQDASVVIHLDLTWNPARLEQRVGRLRRIGAARDAISIYVFAPPAPAERMLRLEERLRVKLGAASRSVGVAGAILPGFVSRDPEAALPREERLLATIRRWRGIVGSEAPVVAATRAHRDGAIACVRLGGRVTLLVLDDERVTDSRSHVERVVEDVLDDEAPVDPARARHMRARVEAWCRHNAVCRVVDLPALRVARSRRWLLQRVDAIARRAPRHRQPDLAPLMHAARNAATATLSIGAERVLDELARSEMSDSAWLHAVGEFAALHANGREEPGELLVLLLLSSC